MSSTPSPGKIVSGDIHPSAIPPNNTHNPLTLSGGHAIIGNYNFSFHEKCNKKSATVCRHNWSAWQLQFFITFWWSENDELASLSPLFKHRSGIISWMLPLVVKYVPFFHLHDLCGNNYPGYKFRQPFFVFYKKKIVIAQYMIKCRGCPWGDYENHRFIDFQANGN